MATGNEEIRVPIGIPVETNAGKAADSVQALRDRISQSKDAIKSASAAMRDMRGKSNEVKAAKDQLRAKIEAEKNAISSSTLKLVQLGQVQAKVAQTTKGNAAGMNALKNALNGVGIPASAIQDKIGTLTEVLGGAETGLAAIAGAAALAAAAIVVVGAAAAVAAYKLAKFIIVAADAARMQFLTRKANLAGNDSWAKQFGEQIDEIARSVPMAKEKIEEIGIALAKTRIGGQTMVDTMHAVSGAAAAAGDDLGNKLKGIVERGALTRRFQLSPQELLGMDLDFNDVAKAYADGMKISVNAARQALFEGRVRLQDGAAALRKAVEGKFGKINAAKMLSLDNILSKLKADVAGLAKDVNLEPFLKGLKSLADNFDSASVNGKALKNVVTTIGNAIGVSFEAGVPALQQLIDKGVWGALKLENMYLRLKVSFKEAFGKDLEPVVGQTVGHMLKLWSGLAMFEMVNAAVTDVQRNIDILGKSFAQVDWEATGRSVVDGIVNGIESGAIRLADKVKGLATTVKRAFTGEMEIHSPSRVGDRWGQSIDDGVIGGVEKRAPAVQRAVEDMAPSSLGGGGSKGGRAPASITWAPVIHVNGGGADVQGQVRAALVESKKEFLAMLQSAGVEFA